jgi:hypothetical protein
MLLGCAGTAPVELDQEDDSCPDISGNYCAVGARWRTGEAAVTETHLGYRLGFDTADVLQRVDRVEIDGAADGVMTLKLHAGDREYARAELRRPELMCGEDRVVFRTDSLPWGGGIGGPFPVIAAGGSGGWRLFHRDERGALRVMESVRNTGLLYLAIPLSWKQESWMRFLPAAGGCDP